MYSVVAHNADPYLGLDTPALFPDYTAALQYAIDIAVVFWSARGAPNAISIFTPDGERLEWSIGGLLFMRRLGDKVSK